LDEPLDPGSAGAERSEPVGRAERRAGAARRQQAARPELADEVKALLPDELIDELLAGARTQEEIAGPGGLLGQLTKRLVERAMEVELTDHLGYEPHQEPAGGAGNTRNGSTPKTLITEQGEVAINTPRDRAGTFEPQIVRKRQRRFEGFDDKILALYSRGLSTRDIEAHLEEIYGVRVGRDLISKVTDAVMDDARAWQTRPLEDVYPVVFLDALVLKIRDGGSVQRKACYLAMAITMDGDREVLGMWFQANEGAKFWMQVLNDLKQRGIPGHPHLLRRRPQRVPRSDRGRVPPDHGPDVHRASDPPQPEVRAAPSIRRRGQRSEADLHRERPRTLRSRRSRRSRRSGANSCP